MNRKRTAAILLAVSMLCGCSGEKVQANTVPAAVYITTTEQDKPVLTSASTEGIMAQPPKSETAKSTTEAVTEVTTAAEASQPPTTTTTAVTNEIKYKNTIEINGPNLVYTGESFKFTYKISHKNAERASVLWQLDGTAGRLSDDGTFEALEAGEVRIKISDISNGLTDSLTVHIADSPDDVDFLVEVNGIPIANKTYPVPADYNPGLSNETYNAFLELKQAALDDGIDIYFMSGFRSYGEQVEVYEGWRKVYDDEADRISARPGYSEHQLGLSIDVNSTEFSFADTEEGKWLAKNCHKYGFIIRYKKEMEDITGYMFEPWHIRYLGKELAEEVYLSGLTLEEYLGIDSYYRIKEYKSDEEELEQ